MDHKIKKYQAIITEVLKEYEQTWNHPNDQIKTQAVFDLENNHFQLMSVGWQNNKYYCYIVFHFDIKDAKVWIQENRTDILIGQELENRGIPKSDIVLGLQPPEFRTALGYAAA